MAVYTKITFNELVNIISKYKIGKLIEFSGIKEGIENTNYFIKTTQGKFILTIFENRVKNEDIPFFVKVMQHLNDNNFPCPTPLENSNNIIIQSFKKKFFIIVDFLEGKSKSRPNKNNCFELGKFIANMHLKTKDFVPSRNNNLSFFGWKKLINLCYQKISMQEILNLDKSLPIEIDSSYNKCEKYWPKNLTKGFIHGDVFPDNVFFINNKITGIIDFYFSCNDYLAYDIAIIINAWCFNKNQTFCPLKFQNLMIGYEKVRPLLKKEKKSLSLLCEGAALRFLLTRLYDWFNTPDNAYIKKKDPIEYLKKLKFFKNNDTLVHYEK